uniref:Uncharacterized protein n=1 Tax=Magallana gigas TaxID=29159 RepID=K1QHT1_MAGGI
MAEEFLKFQDNEDELSRSFKDFEEEWLRLGQEFSVVFDAGNSQDLHKIEENEPAANLNQIQGFEPETLRECLQNPERNQ